MRKIPVKCFTSRWLLYYSHVLPGDLLREILNKDRRRKRLKYPKDQNDTTVDDTNSDIERKTIELLLEDKLSYTDKLPVSSSDDSFVSEPDDPLHDDSLLKDLLYTTRVSNKRQYYWS